VSSDELRAIAALRAAWTDAVAARNPDALEDLLTDDYEVWAQGAPPIIGPAAAAVAMRGAVERFDIVQSFEPLETVVAGDWAFERGIERMVLTPRDGGEKRTLEQRTFLIERKGPDGKWRFARGMTNQVAQPA
jgi:ketosteroid isomerase-like protein